jgi:hypothetical protein
VYQRYAIKDFPFYANHTHNDWAEFAADGGLPFLLIVGPPNRASAKMPTVPLPTNCQRRYAPITVRRRPGMLFAFRSESAFAFCGIPSPTFPRTPFSASGTLPALRPGRFSLTKANTSATIGRGRQSPDDPPSSGRQTHRVRLPRDIIAERSRNWLRESWPTPGPQYRPLPKPLHAVETACAAK